MLEAKSVALQLPPTPIKHIKLQQKHELTPRTVLTLTMLTLIIILCLALASLSVFPTHPNLRILAIILTALAEWSCFAAVRRSARTRLPQLRFPASFPSCDVCRVPKSPRTHHCSTCGVCTPRMCHHCGILGVCIGAHNYKAFVLLLFYGMLSAAILVSLCAREAVGKVTGLFRREIRLTFGVFMWLELYYIQFCMTIILGGLLLFHLYLIAVNRTVLEACVLRGSGKVFPPWRRHVAPFEKGLVGNFEEVFGGFSVALLPVIDRRSMAKMEANNILRP